MSVDLEAVERHRLAFLERLGTAGEHNIILNIDVPALIAEVVELRARVATPPEDVERVADLIRDGIRGERDDTSICVPVGDLKVALAALAAVPADEWTDPKPYRGKVSGQRLAHPLAGTYWEYKPRTRAEFDAEAEGNPKRLDPDFRADLIEFARDRIESVWADVPGGVDSATLASNIVAAQEFCWMSRQVPVAIPADGETEKPDSRGDELERAIGRARGNPNYATNADKAIADAIKAGRGMELVNARPIPESEENDHDAR